MEHPANHEFVNQMVNTLQLLLLGKPAEPIPEGEDAHPELAQLAELINILSGNINELNEFARQLAKGNLEVDLPGRRNYLAGTLKELHAQLSSFVWSVNQLQKGSIVERMDYRGELSDALNSLIAHMVDLSAGRIQVAESSEPSPVNSWQYHQIYLAFNHLQMMVIEAETDGRIVFANVRAKELFGDIEMLMPEYAPPELRGLVRELPASNDNAAFPLFREMFNEPNGKWYKITSDRITFPDGRTVYLHVIEDISEWKTSVQKLHISATTDGLTGVFNRSAGMGELEALMADLDDSTHCVGFIDIDGLKPINDNYGHSEGDYTISTIADVLSATVRATDIISRIGGDEFLLIFRDCTMVEAEAVIRRMLDTIEQINRTHEKPFALSFSHGLVQIAPDSHISAGEIVMLADKKMYERKSTKKHRAGARRKTDVVTEPDAQAKRKTDQETTPK